MLKMRQNYILYLIIGCTMMLASCSQSSNNAKTTALAEDDRPPLEYSDADRTFDVVLDITSDSLITCNNNFSGKDDNPLILDTSNPRFSDLFSEWFASSFGNNPYPEAVLYSYYQGDSGRELWHWW